MTTTFVYPTTTELRLIEQDKLPNLLAQRPIFDIFKLRESDNHILSWEQQDTYKGLQQLRGINGEPTRVTRLGAKRFIAQPGVYGEYTAIDEQELLVRRQFGTLNTPIGISDLVMMEQDKLLGRRLDRIELIGWTLLSTGTFSVAVPNGAVVHTDTYTTQTYSAIVPWATEATAAPLFNLREVKLKARGHSVRFDQSAKAYLNSVTMNYLLQNINPADIYGRRTNGLQTINSPAQVAELFAQDGLPTLVEYDKGYLDANGTWQPFIPDNKVIVVGNRDTGATVAEYVMTRNVNNPAMSPGAYTRVIDRGEDRIPRIIEVHDGHNGGPTMLFPSSIVVMSV